MISLRKTADDLERLQEALRTAEEHYSKIIRVCGESAVEFDVHAAEELREQLRALEAQFKRGSPAPEFAPTFEFLRNRLEAYRAQGNDRISRMRDDLKSATAAIKVFADGVSTGAADHKMRLQQEVNRLESLGGSNDLKQIRAGIREVSAAILDSHQQLDRSHRLVISQLQDEIRMLHSVLDAERHRRSTDQVSGAWNRQTMTARIDVLIASNQPFCVLVVGITNWTRIQGQYSQGARQAALRAFFVELQKFLGADQAVGRWSDNLFLGVVEANPAAALNISGELKRGLPNSYTVIDGSARHTVKLDASVGVIDRREGVDSARFYVKLKQLTDTLGGL